MGCFDIFPRKKEYIFVKFLAAECQTSSSVELNQLLETLKGPTHRVRVVKRICAGGSAE